jgi:hypothetical protein
MGYDRLNEEEQKKGKSIKNQIAFTLWYTSIFLKNKKVIKNQNTQQTTNDEEKERKN